MKNRSYVVVLASTALCASLVGCGHSSDAAPVSYPTQTTSAELTPQPGETATTPSSNGMPTVGQNEDHAELPAATGTPAEEATLNDAQIAGTAQRIGMTEMDAGRLAATHAKSAKVRQFAQLMVKSYGAFTSKLASTMKTEKITPEESALCDKITADAQAQKQAIMGQEGFDFDRAYMNEELRDHEDSLALLDNRLLPEAKNPGLKAVLEAARAKVVDHIQMAKDVLGSLPAP